MIFLFIQNKNTGDKSYTTGNTMREAVDYFNKWYALNWKVTCCIKGDYATDEYRAIIEENKNISVEEILNG